MSNMSLAYFPASDYNKRPRLSEMLGKFQGDLDPISDLVRRVLSPSTLLPLLSALMVSKRRSWTEDHLLSSLNKN